jgi:hypothetical protein
MSIRVLAGVKWGYETPTIGGEVVNSRVSVRGAMIKVGLQDVVVARNVAVVMTSCQRNNPQPPKIH